MNTSTSSEAQAVVVAANTNAGSTGSGTAIRPFMYRATDAELKDLRQRIKATKFPNKETVPDATQGVQLATAQAIAAYWASEYDWRKVEARLNAFPQFMTEIDGMDIHFVHVKSQHKNALPIIVTHGWPGSVIEQLKRRDHHVKRIGGAAAMGRWIRQGIGLQPKPIQGEQKMFSHVVVGTNDLDKAKRFYDSVLGALGHGEGVARPRGGYAYPSDKGLFIVAPPLDGHEATHANGGTIGFACQSAEQVDLWHAAGIASGGTSIEDPPGVRDTPAGKLYLAYMRDPDGNKLCALHQLSA